MGGYNYTTPATEEEKEVIESLLERACNLADLLSHSGSILQMFILNEANTAKDMQMRIGNGAVKMCDEYYKDVDKQYSYHLYTTNYRELLRPLFEMKDTLVRLSGNFEYYRDIIASGEEITEDIRTRIIKDRRVNNKEALDRTIAALRGDISRKDATIPELTQSVDRLQKTLAADPGSPLIPQLGFEPTYY